MKSYICECEESSSGYMPRSYRMMSSSYRSVHVAVVVDDVGLDVLAKAKADVDVRVRVRARLRRPRTQRTTGLLNNRLLQAARTVGTEV